MKIFLKRKNTYINKQKKNNIKITHFTQHFKISIFKNVKNLKHLKIQAIKNLRISIFKRDVMAEA